MGTIIPSAWAEVGNRPVRARKRIQARRNFVFIIRLFLAGSAIADKTGNGEISSSGRTLSANFANFKNGIFCRLG
jgi:hypothetical protein